MHHIDDSNIDEDQLAEFGGIKFAVDIYDDELKIILLESKYFNLDPIFCDRLMDVTRCNHFCKTRLLIV